jgi:hypothetical protein
VLGRGVSSCRLLDALGKGFADFVRDRVVDVPVCLLEGGGDGLNGHVNGHGTYGVNL